MIRRSRVQGVDCSAAPLGPVGVYQVNYRVTSADGHPVTGQRTFRLTVAGTGTPAMPWANRRAIAGVAVPRRSRGDPVGRGWRTCLVHTGWRWRGPTALIRPEYRRTVCGGGVGARRRPAMALAGVAGRRRRCGCGPWRWAPGPVGGSRLDRGAGVEPSLRVGGECRPGGSLPVSVGSGWRRPNAQALRRYASRSTSSPGRGRSDPAT